jgi:hypothetical protein
MSFWILRGIQLRTADLKKYVNGVNSDDKLMLMAVPIAREVIEGVVLDDVNLPVLRAVCAEGQTIGVGVQ